MKALDLADDLVDTRRASGIIRLIEEDNDVRAVVTASLVAMGYSVIPLATLDHECETVTASLVDVTVLRRSSNWALAYLRMGGPVLFVTNTLDDEDWLVDQLGLLPSNLLRKPFTPRDLANRLREVIGPSATAGQPVSHLVH